MRHVDNKFIIEKGRNAEAISVPSRTRKSGPDKSFTAPQCGRTHRDVHTCFAYTWGRDNTPVARNYSRRQSLSRERLPPAVDRDLWRGLGKFSLAALLQWHRPTTGARRVGTTLENFGTKLNARPRPLHAFRCNVPDLQVRGKRHEPRARVCNVDPKLRKLESSKNFLFLDEKKRIIDSKFRIHMILKFKQWEGFQKSIKRVWIQLKSYF